MRVLTFFVLTFAVSWSLFVAAASLTGWPIDGLSPGILAGGAIGLIGVFAPALVALALTAYFEGRAAAGILLRRTVALPAQPGYLLFAATYLAAIKLAAALVHRGVTGTWPLLGPTPIVLMAVATMVSTPVQAGEEVGWRGFALDRLSKRMGLGAASLLVGVIWAFWHLPLFYLRGSDTFGQSFPLFVTEVTALSVALAWLYWRTGRSLLATMLMHAAANNTKDILPSMVPGATDPLAFSSSRPAWITATLLWICASGFLIDMARKRARL